ncbi:MAG: DNA-3-methyladenine glycosylase [Pirellulaceae bacterium]
MPFFAQHVRSAQTHLKKNDETMRNLIREVGPFTLKAQRHHFNMLVRSIISQQISTAAARTILGRVHEFAGDPVSPEALAGVSIDEFRQLGVSQQKASYLIDLTAKVNSGVVDLKKVSRKADSEVIDELIQVKGIGVWTAQMFMMFSLARMDVLPAGDLGIRNAIKQAYGFAELPSPAEIEEVAQPWRPYATIASWYLWRSLELQPK